MRALGIFEKVTLLSLVVLKVQVQGNNRYSWNAVPGCTEAIGLKDGWPFLLSFPRSMDRYITLSLEPSLPHLDPEMWFVWLRHVCVVRKCYVVSDKGSRKQIWVKWSVCKNDGQGQVWHILSERTVSILDFSGHTVPAPLLQHISSRQPDVDAQAWLRSSDILLVTSKFQSHTFHLHEVFFFRFL